MKPGCALSVARAVTNSEHIVRWVNQRAKAREERGLGAL